MSAGEHTAGAPLAAAGAAKQDRRRSHHAVLCCAVLRGVITKPHLPAQSLPWHYHAYVLQGGAAHPLACTPKKPSQSLLKVVNGLQARPPTKRIG